MAVVESFRTSRLTAERLQESHFGDLVALHLDPDVSRFLGGVRSAEATREYLTLNLAHWDRHGSGLWILRTQTGEFAGRAGIRHIAIDDVTEVEIAYTFRRALWGQGLASEIATALTDIGLSQLALPSLIGVVAVENIASRRVLEKAGYTLERSTHYHGAAVVVYRAPSSSP